MSTPPPYHCWLERQPAVVEVPDGVLRTSDRLLSVRMCLLYACHTPGTQICSHLAKPLPHSAVPQATPLPIRHGFGTHGSCVLAVSGPTPHVCWCVSLGEAMTRKWTLAVVSADET